MGNLKSLETGFSPELLWEIRDKFVNVDSDPFTGKRIYFENAGGTLKLKSVLKVVELYTGLPDNAGRRNATSRNIKETIENGRRDIALFLGARSGAIMAEQSTTAMLFRILRTIAENVKGGNIVTSNLDHASAYDATQTMAKRYGLEFRVAEFDPDIGIVPVESILEKVDENTIALTITHSSNILGTRNDVTKIVREIREINHNSYVIIDGAQHASHGLIDVEEYGADAYLFSPYKTYSKSGIAFAYVSDRLANLPHDQLMGKARGFLDLGTCETAAYASMSKVVEYLQWLGSHFTDSDDPRTKVVEGMLAIEKHELFLLKTLLYGINKCEGMLGIDNVTVYGEKKNLNMREPIVAFNIKNVSTSSIVDYFEENKVRLHNRSLDDGYSKQTLMALGIKECIRVSLCHYNTMDEVETFLKLLKEFAEHKV
ncbi:MAG: aminotransferase class V-fold PLP-dependent enzyme [Candidatus Bathyarchaeia archaeon]